MIKINDQHYQRYENLTRVTNNFGFFLACENPSEIMWFKKYYVISNVYLFRVLRTVDTKKPEYSVTITKIA